jgi:putative restriction endonuclease
LLVLKDNWHHLVSENKFTANFALPFYHLLSEKFWFLKTSPGRELSLTSSHSIKSFSHLKEVIDYAFFDPHLYQLLTESGSREMLKQTLLESYFHIYSYEVPETLSLAAEIRSEILKETPATYKTKAETFDEEEVFVRSGVFKKVVPQIYNYSCCISGMRIIASSEAQMIDACHIIPFQNLMMIQYQWYFIMSEIYTELLIGDSFQLMTIIELSFQLRSPKVP